MPPPAVMVPVSLTLGLLAVLALTVAPEPSGEPGDLLLSVEKAAATVTDLVMK